MARVDRVENMRHWLVFQPPGSANPKITFDPDEATAGRYLDAEVHGPFVRATAAEGAVEDRDALAGAMRSLVTTMARGNLDEIRDAAVYARHILATHGGQ